MSLIIKTKCPYCSNYVEAEYTVQRFVDMLEKNPSFQSHPIPVLRHRLSEPVVCESCSQK